jgi:hypothetical protein
VLVLVKVRVWVPGGSETLAEYACQALKDTAVRGMTVDPSIFMLIEGQPPLNLVPLAMRLTDETLVSKFTCPLRLVAFWFIFTALPPLAAASLTILAPAGSVICSA